MQKDLYEALRAGKGWNRTLFLIVYDGKCPSFVSKFHPVVFTTLYVRWPDSGGTYDHVVPPFEGVPNDEADCHIKPGCPTPFDFRRLGSRLAALLISPWVDKGSVFQEPKGKSNSSQFELSSVPATLKELFNLSSFLTKRDAWAGSMDELISTRSEPRTGVPLHLPAAPTADNTNQYENGLESRRRVESLEPRHCSAHSATCADVGAVTQKQRRKIAELAVLTLQPQPNIDRMTFSSASAWLEQRFMEWMSGTS